VQEKSKAGLQKEMLNKNFRQSEFSKKVSASIELGWKFAFTNVTYFLSKWGTEDYHQLVTWNQEPK
jgi:hypothetical protein